jgi:RimJ/RimL family protein N-acetyltransferase
MSKVALVALSKDNWQEVARLEVLPHQKDFVANNLWTIAESQFYPWTFRKVILAHGKIVGFAVYGVMPDDDQMWLHRFMVAGTEQRSGIGKAALRLLIEEWKQIPGLTIVKLSYEPGNDGAEHLYVSEGFVPGEIAEWGERIATLDLTTREFAESGSMHVCGRA